MRKRQRNILSHTYIHLVTLAAGEKHSNFLLFKKIKFLNCTPPTMLTGEGSCFWRGLSWMGARGWAIYLRVFKYRLFFMRVIGTFGGRKMAVTDQSWWFIYFGRGFYWRSLFSLWDLYNSHILKGRFKRGPYFLFLVHDHTHWSSAAQWIAKDNLNLQLNNWREYFFSGRTPYSINWCLLPI